jgi:hypothetical protein
MKKEDLQKIEDTALEAVNKMRTAFKDYVKENPIILFTPEEAEEDGDIINDMPSAFDVSKHFYYLEGKVMKVEGDNFTLFLTGECDYGDTRELSIDYLYTDTMMEIIEAHGE